jgi:7-carboxy-7-deazaguanine synthase
MITKKENKQDITLEGIVLPLMEEFYTIQGEGYHSGKAAYFIRVGGCDVGCHWCDVKESWDAALHPPTAVDLIVKNAAAFPAKAVVVTGGEPAMYPLSYLTTELKKKGILTFLETSGAYPISGTWDWICLSPKKTGAPLDENLARADELKVIVYNLNDLEWGEKYAKLVRPDCKLFLQPEWSKAPQIMPVIVEYVMNHPEWNVSLQTHKYMHIP